MGARGGGGKGGEGKGGEGGGGGRKRGREEEQESGRRRSGWGRGWRGAGSARKARRTMMCIHASLSIILTLQNYCIKYSLCKLSVAHDARMHHTPAPHSHPLPIAQQTANSKRPIGRSPQPFFHSTLLSRPSCPITVAVGVGRRTVGREGRPRNAQGERASGGGGGVKSGSCSDLLDARREELVRGVAHVAIVPDERADAGASQLCESCEDCFILERKCWARGTNR